MNETQPVAKITTSNHCASCYEPKERPKQCSGCKVANYCNITCQKNGWKSTHKAQKV